MYKNHLIFVINFLKIKVIEGYRIIIVINSRLERRSTEDTTIGNVIIFPRFPVTPWADPNGHWTTSEYEVGAAARSCRSRRRRKLRRRRRKRRANSVNQGIKSRTLKRESVDSCPNDSNCIATDKRMRVRMWDYV